ncbi:MAG: AmmeMemoRadiSam system radical SAM enzyme [Desulfuromonadales bacterium]|nr:AmmeMemoRadiSam system radical SAM enzyme [Desulfuromonadales bacterium]
MEFQNLQKYNSGKTQCMLCPRECILANGQSGFCYVKKNEDGKIVLLTYGYNTGLAIDPIEKKPLYHFLPGSKTLSFGTLGCNMGCKFCQNWHMSKSKSDIKKSAKYEPTQIAQIAKANNCESVSLTYNDPVIFFEYAINTAKECRKLGIKTVAVTAGYINDEPRREFFKWMDATNIDLKGFSEEFYRKNCDAHLEPVLKTIEYVKTGTDCHLEITTLLIEGENDSDQELKAQCEWIAKTLGSDVPLHFSAFYPCYEFMHKSPTTVETLQRAYNIAKEYGLKYVYLGNIQNASTSTTYCHNCHNPIIERQSIHFLKMNLTDLRSKGANCKFCGVECAGVFE